ncbi:DUF6520 family protein [Gelidibacter gilvus]|uniref:Uncharacterized protein n=1 Tax=Gelidibacter gilvus TaxID=59602 RepID=A0A4Q0XG47_9FLAO|nr:DUF6520 family protein [Gelidibacter gilvus]RXJ45686.1 hypothetical protein ESZ48_14910 [Gelidibacter gilvus]
MKTKVFKSVMPVFVMLMAVGLAFATERIVVERDAYYNIPGTTNWEHTTVGDECFTGGANACSFLGQQLYAAPDFNSMKLMKP